MSISRRDFIKLAGLFASGATLASCQPIYSELAGGGPRVDHLPTVSSSDFTALSRMTFGPRIQDRDRVHQIGLHGWIEEQLAHQNLDNQDLWWRLRPYDILKMDAVELMALGDELFDGVNPAPVVDDFKKATLIRQIYSEHQLYEVMVEFWSDHFNISIDKGDCWFLKVVDDREVIRTHALGNFQDLLLASAKSPAMLVYLDNQANLAHSPNENYAREVLELHTLGVDGGYSQQDVMELARCLTGWTVKENFWRGEFEFNPDFHDWEPKRLLGMEIEPVGLQETERVLANIALRPTTARFIVQKLAARFLGEDPPQGVIEAAVNGFLDSGGDIRETLKPILFDGFSNPIYTIRPKFKRPGQFINSSLRILGAETNGGIPLHDLLSKLGQPLYQWPTPDGAPDSSDHWIGNLMPRWQFASRWLKARSKGLGSIWKACRNGSRSMIFQPQ